MRDSTPRTVASASVVSRARSGTDHLLWLLRRALCLARTEGAGGLATGLRLYLRYRVVWNTDFVIMSTDTSTYQVGLPMPPVNGLEVHVLHSEADVDRLVAKGYEDVRSVVRRSSHRFKHGAVAFCAYVHGSVAHIAWVALDESAKRALAPIPCQVAFDQGEGYWGGSMTVRRFRNLGIYKHVMALRLQYCNLRGRTVLVDATEVGNAASLKAQGIYGPHVRAVYRYRRVLWMKRGMELPAAGEYVPR